MMQGKHSLEAKIERPGQVANSPLPLISPPQCLALRGCLIHRREATLVTSGASQALSYPTWQAVPAVTIYQMEKLKYRGWFG